MLLYFPEKRQAFCIINEPSKGLSSDAGTLHLAANAEHQSTTWGPQRVQHKWVVDVSKATCFPEIVMLEL